ncbi:hypothetical protein LIER_24925 [Lithospermum erythrorhizon]|uniref:Uncharacterized protein n=1 Tax=Lithospermum erythrorhizon TaxID=34254 RepID=A0AAV3R549_LITER
MVPHLNSSSNPPHSPSSLGDTFDNSRTHQMSSIEGDNTITKNNNQPTDSPQNETTHELPIELQLEIIPYNHLEPNPYHTQTHLYPNPNPGIPINPIFDPNFILIDQDPQGFINLYPNHEVPEEAHSLYISIPLAIIPPSPTEPLTEHDLIRLQTWLIYQ